MTHLNISKRSILVLLTSIAGLGLLGCGEKDEREIRAEILHSARVTAVSFSHNGRVLATASEDNTIRLLDVTDLHSNYNSSAPSVAMPNELDVSPLVGSGTGFKSLAFSPLDQSMLAAGSYHYGTEGVIQFWNTDRGDLLFELKGHRHPVQTVAFHPLGSSLASGAGKETDLGETELWDLDNRLPIGTFDPVMGGVHSVGFSPDGTMLAGASGDGLIRVWWSEDQSVRYALSHNDHRPYAVAFSRDNAFLATAGNDSGPGFNGQGGVIRIWDMTDGSLAHSLDLGNYTIRALTYSPDGTLLAAAGDDQIIKLVDPNTFELVETLKGHAERINSLSFSSNGQLLASASDDKYVRIWSMGDLVGHTCEDGLDNDGDGWIDAKDPDCLEGSREIGFGQSECNDGEDNDSDNSIDAADLSCNDGFGDDEGTTDMEDAGTLDAGQTDTDEPDAGQPDTDEPDTDKPDAGEQDAGQIDGGSAA